MTVEAVELVVTALTAGAAAGMKDTATLAVKDSYAGLVKVVRSRLGREVKVLDEHAADPEAGRDELIAALTAADAGEDEQLIAAARDLLAQVDQAGKYSVEVHDSKGVQIGDGNTMHLKF